MATRSSGLDTRQLLALHRAALAISSEVDLERVLWTILRTAVRLLHARYGALGIPDGDGDGFGTFLHVGIPARTVRRIGHLPRLHGLLGSLLRDGGAIRSRDIRRHPEFTGYPPHHPPLADFLGVPIRYRGEILGELFLSGVPARTFTAADQRLVELLAAHAAVAIVTAERVRARQEAVARDERQRVARELEERVTKALATWVREAPRARDGAVRMDGLTPRERDVLALLAEGLANKEIARRLGLGEKTVKTHVSRILGKLDVTDRTQAAVAAVRGHLVQ
jgi:DNA-binding CsgD family transcriptional regulator/transcriptional regulator with GAF, ATPase, and Fis domain